MILNRNGRDELRKTIAYQLNIVPDGQKVHINQELLNELLFETIVYNKETKGFFKLPVWSGSFLKKIDLSEVCFDQVSWLLLSESGKATAEQAFKDMEFDEDAYRVYTEIVKKIESNEQLKPYYVDYSNTNARIDFSKSFTEWFLEDEYFISGVNFYGVDLSYLDISFFYAIEDSNLGNTRIKVASLDERESCQELIRVSLENIDLSPFTLDAHSIINHETLFNECNLAGTKLNITYHPDDFPLNSEERILLAHMIKKGYFNGCYINGKIIHSLEERKKIATEKEEEYHKLKENIITEVKNDILKQVILTRAKKQS